MCAAFGAAMDDDLNTPQAVAALAGLVNAGNKLLEAGAGSLATRTKLKDVRHALLDLGGVFGLFGERGGDERLSDDIRGMIEERERARNTGDYAEADRIRAELAGRGIILEDGPEGTTWRKE